MTGDPNKWVDLYHPGLKVPYRATDAAYQEIYRFKGWVLRDDAAAVILTDVLADPDAASDELLRLAMGAVYPSADPAALTRDEMVANVKVLPHHVDADTAVGQRLAQLLDAPPNLAVEAVVLPETGLYDPNDYSNMAVNEYLQAQIDADNLEEVERVLKVEKKGQNRKGIVVDGPAAKLGRE